MSSHKTKDKVEGGIYLIIRQDILGTAEDDVILGYKKTRKDAETFLRNLNDGNNEDFHYCLKRTFELENG